MGFLLCDGMQLMYWVKREKAVELFKKKTSERNIQASYWTMGDRWCYSALSLIDTSRFTSHAFTRRIFCFVQFIWLNSFWFAANRIIQVCITLAHFVWSVGVLNEKRTEVYAYKTICLAHFNEFLCLLPITLFIDSVHGLSNMFVSTFIILITIQIFIL